MQPNPRGLKILFVGHVPPYQGGGAILNSQVLHGLAALGHTIHVISAITPAGLAQGADRGNNLIPVTFYPIPRPMQWPADFTTREWVDLEATQIEPMFHARIAQQRPDLVLWGHERYTWLGPNLSRSVQLPCIMLFHSGATIRWLDHMDEARRRRFLANLREANLVITVAEHLAQAYQRWGLNRVQAIPNGVDLAHFAPRPKPHSLLEKLGLSEDNFIVMHLSNLKPVKRPLDLVSSAREAIPLNSNLRYVVLGDGLMRSQLEDACRQAGLGDFFRFVGWIDRQYLPEYYGLADLVVMPSEAEGMALVYLETQACGRVLLASDIPAAREVIRDGETGLLFRMGDIDDLTAKTLQAAGDSKLRVLIGSQARTLAHSVAATVGKYAAVCEQAVGRSTLVAESLA